MVNTITIHREKNSSFLYHICYSEKDKKYRKRTQFFRLFFIVYNNILTMKRRDTIKYMVLASIALLFLLHFLINNPPVSPFVEIEYKNIRFEANYSYLHYSHHASKLISRFPCSNKQLKILILVVSNIAFTAQREIIRRTWGRGSQIPPFDDFRLFFVCGILKSEAAMKPIFHEGMMYKDIIFVNSTDAENEFSYKYEAMFEFATKHCVYDYLITLQEDVFINLSRLVTLLHRFPAIPENGLYLGRVKERQKITSYRNKRTTPLDKHLSVCDLRAALFSHKAVQKFIPYFQNETFEPLNVYIGLLAMNAGVEPINSDQFMATNTENCVYDNVAVALPATYYFNDNCLEVMFFSMLSQNFHDPFIKQHYFPNKVNTKKFYTSPAS